MPVAGRSGFFEIELSNGRSGCYHRTISMEKTGTAVILKDRNPAYVGCFKSCESESPPHELSTLLIEDFGRARQCFKKATNRGFKYAGL